MRRRRIDVPREAWPAIKAVRDACGLTYQQVADALGMSQSSAKQGLLGYRPYLAPGGNYSMKKPASEEGGSEDAASEQGPGES